MTLAALSSADAASRRRRLLYRVHGFQIFEVGAFNADPHAGNILLDENTQTVSLIDYGQLVQISEKDRVAFVTAAGGSNPPSEC